MSDATWRNMFEHLKLGAICFDNGTVVPIDWRDLMWAVRAVRGEAGFAGSDTNETDAILWTMTNRLRIVEHETIGRGPARHAPPHRLHHVLLSYCAPINPYQRTRGTEETQARRRHFAVMNPDDPDIFKPSIGRVIRFLRGEISRTPYMRYVDFAACDCEGCGRDTHGPEDLQLDDCFWIGPGGAQLNERSVWIAPPSGRHGRAVLAGATFVAGAAGLLRLAR